MGTVKAYSKEEFAAWECVFRARPAKVDIVPPGWKTIAQAAHEAGVGYSTMKRRIREAMAEGKFETRTFRMRSNGTRLTYPVPHYRPKAASRC